MAIAPEVELKQPAETSHTGEKARTRCAPRNGADALDQLIGGRNIDAGLLVIQSFLPGHLNFLVFAIPHPPALPLQRQRILKVWISLRAASEIYLESADSPASRKRSRARRAACCSDCFLLLPSPRPSTLPWTTISVTKCLA